MLRPSAFILRRERASGQSPKRPTGEAEGRPHERRHGHLKNGNQPGDPSSVERSQLPTHFADDGLRRVVKNLRDVRHHLQRLLLLLQDILQIDVGELRIVAEAV
jgi:hypothetical protein